MGRRRLRLLRVLAQQDQRLRGQPAERLRQVGERGLVPRHVGGLGEEAEHRLAGRDADPGAGLRAEPGHVECGVGRVPERAHRDRGHPPAPAGETRGTLVAHEVGPGVRAVDRVGVAGVVLEREGRAPARPGQQRLVETHAERGDGDHEHVRVHPGEQRRRGLEQRARLGPRRHMLGAVGQGEAQRPLARGGQRVERGAARRDGHLQAAGRAQRGRGRLHHRGAPRIAGRKQDADRRHGLARPAPTTASASAQSSGVSMSMASITPVGSGRRRGGNRRRCRARLSRVQR